MSISSIQNNQHIPHQLSQTGNKNQLRTVADGDNDRGIEKSQQGVSGTLGNTIQQTLSQLGLGQTSNNSNDPQALQSFIQNLFSAIQAQQATNTTSQAKDSDGDNDGSGTASSTEGDGGRGGQLQAGIQSLIQQLATSTNTSGTNSSLSSLEQSFQNLVSSEAGGTTATTSSTLSSFLQSLSQNLQGSGAVGNLIDTKG